jgi:hypothetical protein
MIRIWVKHTFSDGDGGEIHYRKIGMVQHTFNTSESDENATLICVIH